MNETLRHSYKLSRNFQELNLTCLFTPPAICT